MKTFAHSLIALVALFTSTLAAPTPAEDFSFPITDVIGTDLTVEEYAHQLESQSAAEPALAKRQYSGSTYNQLTDGTPCRDITIIYARGTNQDGNVGDSAAVGPIFFNAVASKLGGTSRLAIQGVTYSASIVGFLQGGDPTGGTTMYNLINTAASKCPSTKIVLSGYSQGAQLVHTATQRLSAAVAARVSAVVTFGDADRDETFGSVASSKILIICHSGDQICDNTIIVTPAHLNYQQDAPTAAAFVVSKV